MNDKDNASTLVTGILIAGEVQRRNDEARREQEEQNRRLSEQNQDLQKHKDTIEEKNKNLQSYTDDIEYDAEVLLLKNIRLEDRLQQYQQLLSKPLAEIAAQNDGFKLTYDKHMETIADWMVSQKAFKELAIRLGAEKGLSPQDVIRIGLDMEIDVLENKHDPSHKTNVGNSTVIGPHVEKLKEKFAKRKEQEAS